MKTKYWILRGVFWGIGMFIFMSILLPLMDKEVLMLKKTILSLFLWIVFGLLYEIINDRINRKNKEEIKKQWDNLDKEVEDSK